MQGKKKIFIGIFSSAHETFARAEYEDGTLIGASSVPESVNIHISIKHAWKTIKEAITQALAHSDTKLDSEDVEFHLGMGIKNTELVEACIELRKQNKLFKTCHIASDGHILLLGSHQKDGAIIIIDAGVVGNAISATGLEKIGGWGFPHADRGSIPWVGLEAIGLTIQWLDGFLESSPLLEEIYQYFDNDISKLVKWAMYSRSNPLEYNMVYNLVMDSFAKGDKNAEFLIRSSAQEVIKIYERLRSKAGLENMPCTLYGMLAPHVLPFIGEPLQSNLVKPWGDGTQGAIRSLKLLM